MAGGHRFGGVKLKLCAVAFPEQEAQPVNLLRPCFELMKRHERSFLFCGFLLVFITFAVRDILLNSAQMMADRLSAAESTYLLEDATVQLHQEIDEVDGHVMAGNSDILANRPPRKEHLRWSPNLDRGSVQFLRMISETGSKFASINRLLADLPVDDKNRSEFGILYTRWDRDQMKLLRPVRLIGQKVDPAIARAEAEEDSKNSQDMWDVNRRLAFLGASILDEAHGALEEKEHQACVFRWLSYALYFIGGVLALGTKMAGIETFEG